MINVGADMVKTDDEELRRLVESDAGTRRDLAQRLGISERTLYRRLKDLGLA